MVATLPVGSVELFWSVGRGLSSIDELLEQAAVESSSAVAMLNIDIFVFIVVIINYQFSILNYY